MERKVGQSFRAMVMPIKVKNEIPTVISVAGQVYILQARDQYVGNKEGKKHVGNRVQRKSIG